MTQSKFPITAAALLAVVGGGALQAQSLPAWITIDSVGRAVSLVLESTAAPEPGSGRINGHGAGDIQVLVPLGWTVRWSWRNADSTASHSLVVMAEREKLPLEGGRPALDNAMSRMVTTGLKPGQTDQTTFTADAAGWYWLLCGVPGHALKGEWISFKVDRDALSPGVISKR